MVSPPQVKKITLHNQDQQNNNVPSNLEPKHIAGRTSEDIVTLFMKERDFPNWFRGLSYCQMDAADSLLNNIRDDSEQNTTHRVRDALQRLGIHPPVSPKKIKLAMRLSRGNDIAFLWFLMELYYRGGDKRGLYSLNEQIVMTAISHLDAIPTLRELDKLLPRQPEKPKKPKPKNVPRKKLNYLLPYFEKQVRPVTYGKDLTLKMADSLVEIEYDNYLNPYYVVANESNRWYANYQLNESMRIAKGILDDQLKMVFSSKHDKGGRKAFCCLHENMETVKESLARKLAVTKRDIFRKCFDIEGNEKEKAYRRVTAELNHRIEEAAQELKKIGRPIPGVFKTCNPSCEQKEENGGGTFELIGVPSTRSLPSKPSTIEDEENLDFGHADHGHNEHKYFQAPNKHTPFKFNYAEIFELGARDIVKDLFHRSLGGSWKDAAVDHDERIRAVCEDLWKASVDEYNKEYSRKAKEKRKEYKAVEEGKYYGRAYYNPHDQDLMNEMLLDALNEMRKNKKFVLASFPEAHKTPFLKEFIKKRYGLVKTLSSRWQQFKQSKEIFRILNKTEIVGKMPTTDDVAANRMVSYACSESIKKKTNYLKERCNHGFKLSLMEQARKYWGAVRPYQCTHGPPRNEFFAYMPSREADIHTFRPWKPNEYIRAKEEWDKRQRIKRTQLFQ